MTRPDPELPPPKLLGELFPYYYMGTGYFRRKGVPAGQPAPILHGHQALEFVARAYEARIEDLERQLAAWRAAEERKLQIAAQYINQPPGGSCPPREIVIPDSCDDY